MRGTITRYMFVRDEVTCSEIKLYLGFPNDVRNTLGTYVPLSSTLCGAAFAALDGFFSAATWCAVGKTCQTIADFRTHDLTENCHASL